MRGLIEEQVRQEECATTSRREMSHNHRPDKRAGGSTPWFYTVDVDRICDLKSALDGQAIELRHNHRSPPALQARSEDQAL
jgi:hypothetical protein